MRQPSSNPSRRWTCAIVAIGALSSGCFAQIETPKTVPEGLGDISPTDAPLSVDLSVEMKLPDDWSRVYRGFRSDKYGRIVPFLARRSGALTAVFRQSEYVAVGQNDQVSIVAQPPADTTYYIGELPDNMTIDTSGSWLGWRETTVGPRLISPATLEKRIVPAPRQPEMVATETESTDEQSDPLKRLPTDSGIHIRGVMTDPHYRTDRLNQLIDRAARADRNATGHS